MPEKVKVRNPQNSPDFNLTLQLDIILIVFQTQLYLLIMQFYLFWAYDRMHGPLCRHTACQYNDKLIIFGGKKNAMETSNSLYEFDFMQETWTKLQPKIECQNQIMPYLESHTSCIDQNTQKMYVFGGFEGNDGHINKVFQYDIKSDTWNTLSILGKQPCSRSSHCAVIIKGYMYVFGGQNLNERLGDFWQFNLSNNTWLEITSPNTPQPRNSHSLCVYQDHIILFGGILGITREINDLQCYSVDMEMWIHLEDETKYEDDMTNQNNIDDSQINFGKSFKESSQYQINMNSHESSMIQERKMSNGSHLSRKQSMNNIQQQQDQSINNQTMNSNTKNQQDFAIFQQYTESQKPIQMSHKKSNSFFTEQNTPSMRLYKRQQLRNIFTQQYVFGQNSIGSNSCRNLKIQNPYNSISSVNMTQNDYTLQSCNNSFIRNKAFTEQNEFRKIGVNETINQSNMRDYSFIHSDIKANKNNNSVIKESPNHSQNNIQKGETSLMSNFLSFAVRAQANSQIPQKRGELKESMNTLFDKIKRISMNPLIPKEDKYHQITELRKKILLKEFVEQDDIPNKNKPLNNSIQQNINNTKVSQNKFIPLENNDSSTRFPLLKSPTTDAMRKAIKATENRNKQDGNVSQNKTIQLNMSQMLDQFKSVKIENCRIKNIKPQPRDGHAAIVIEDYLIIIGGDRHRLSFNDMFECNLKRALTNPFTKHMNTSNSPNIKQQNNLFNNFEQNSIKNSIHS